VSTGARLRRILVFLTAPRECLHNLVFVIDLLHGHLGFLLAFSLLAPRDLLHSLLGRVHLGFLLTFSRRPIGGVDIRRPRQRGGMPLDEGKCFLGMGGARASRAQAGVRGDDDRKGRAKDALEYHRDEPRWGCFYDGVVSKEER